MNQNNIILATDSYKLSHYSQYPENTEAVYSYFESREGAEFPYTVFFGLQMILKEFLEGAVVTEQNIAQAKVISDANMGEGVFNLEGWQRILYHHGGKLPVRIKAVPEGTPVPISNVLMTVESTDPKCYWLTNALESILTHVWYTSTVATLSRSTKELIAGFLDQTADSRDALDFMLQDFGYRGATCHEAAARGGLAHLVNFKGTDTLPALIAGINYYAADPTALGFSVPATEHSVMTALGEDGEFDQVRRLLKANPKGILSCVADSYNIYTFVETMGSDEFKNQIMTRDGVFVVRPDSKTDRHPQAADLTTWIVQTLWKNFGGIVNSKGFKVLDPHVRVLWGDGIDPHDIKNILGKLQLAGFSAENMVFGMGGGLLQKVNRDTQRSAFKSSAQKRDGEWHDVFKDPLDSSKKSKKGRLMLVQDEADLWTTRSEFEPLEKYNKLQTVFENGYVVRNYTFDQVRKNASLL